ncbi:MAG: FKBP-type peptidyl-prolyl cis-trans isomerase [Bacteroidales bacterium]|nr:FKBP-type peptidyl-prolyl cis-trans isomerase [Bacteroidales bacterium]
MRAEKDNVVSVIYELRKGSSDGEIIESLDGNNPLTFLFGSGGLLPRFEEHLDGMKAGDHFEFLLNSSDAYGPVIENMVVHVPKHIFEIDGKLDNNLLQTGNVVPMMNAEGKRLNGKILKIEDEVVEMDFNHPMAGQDLYFTGKLIEIRKASDKELEHGHTHGGCSNCSDGHCGDDDHDCHSGH